MDNNRSDPGIEHPGIGNGSEKERGVAGLMASVPGWGARDFGKVLVGCERLSEAIDLSKKQLVELGISELKAERWMKRRGEMEPRQYLDQLGEAGIRVVTVEDDEYPDNLRDTREAPFVLFVRGKLEKADNVAVAIVGTRRPTAYGQGVAVSLGRDLAGFGICVISGLAYGVDALAQRGAYEAGGRTVAVLGNGIDQIQPAANRKLGEAILKSQQGAVMGEYAPGVEAMRQTFPARNRIVSGMSLGVVVVEGTGKSGTLITAEFAKKQGRCLWAVPGPINSVMSTAPNGLIKKGALVYTSIEDVLERIGKMVNKGDERGKVIKTELVTEERRIWEALDTDKSVDELVRELKMPAGQVLASLSMMEIRRVVVGRGGKYGRG